MNQIRLETEITAACRAVQKVPFACSKKKKKTERAIANDCDRMVTGLTLELVVVFA